MKPHEAAPTERLCKAGCDPLPQPIGNFYSRTSNVRDVKLYDHVCKKCLCAREKTRYAGLPKGPAKPRGGAQRRMKDLRGCDVVACKDCGLRGHFPGDADKCAAIQNNSTGLGGRGIEWTL
jgi:hypothetical protein